MKKRLFIGLFVSSLLLLVFFSDCSQKIKGEGDSISQGKVNDGELINGRKFPFSGENYKYFSRISFAVLNRAWVHQKVLQTTLDAYQLCKKSCPDRKFLLMECSHKNGGKMWPHRTHQNGTSIDFGTPLLKNNKIYTLDHHYGIGHYTMSFDSTGVSKMNKKIKIDFETMGKHILALDQSAKKNGMYIKKVIFKIDLKDDFFKSKSGMLVKAKKIYFAQVLPKLIDNQHDEHYHVDFGFL